MSGHAYLVGVGMTPFGRHLDRTHSDLAQEAVRLALGDAGIGAGEIDSTVYATVVQGFFAGEMSIPSQFALRPLGISGVRTLTVEAACASSTIGLHQAVQQVLAGASDVALVVGVEKLFSRDRDKKFAVFQQPLDIAVAQEYVRATRSLVEPAPEGFDQPGPNALMDAYAAQARLHMKTYGTTRAQIAAVASKNHMHSVHNPLSQYREPMTVEEILAAPNVSWPLTVPMCAPISDGGSAAVVVSEGVARRIGLARAVRIRACDSLTGQDRAPDDYANHVTRLVARKVFDRAGLGPQDCQLAEVHDASSIGEMLQVEAMGLCPPGGAGPAAEAGELSLGGRIPVNVSGGLVSKGHPLGATGLGQIHELVTQLRGEAGARQVNGARIAVAENSGGFYGVEDGMSAVTVLEKA
ncbi:thiolase family protein [Novosphingobium mangrovi (ex Huang et al. 2023)]|uniref:propanoyl-CoA C-acyltransferase n=1 Tax=Novosphingobium mangrovi (ex Huang et al. 2023) TaxID=2976432 RepID=A0ABT2I3D7_9SPHN|nr:thiolase family protein [Novosphingobium mangrovi (ex Huang et al. 2023)]MCT2399319.1 thiolase family protein [Novosphingobium mangrovi (ex Huang et al. 2023)]